MPLRIDHITGGVLVDPVQIRFVVLNEDYHSVLLLVVLVLEESVSALKLMLATGLGRLRQCACLDLHSLDRVAGRLHIRDG
jgi:hypothetical protein